jgi:VIT1/CCC1 family predicted Fe2+/Mn2+ transporter
MASSSLSRTQKAARLRNIIFGVEDSLFSTVGLLSGIAVADTPRSIILLTGTVLIFVEAFSMAAGSFLSESSAEEYASQKRTPALGSQPLTNGVIMLASYGLSGFVPLAPYLIISGPLALPCSIGASLISLLLLGLWGGRVSGGSLWRSSVRMALIGGMAIAVGIIASSFVNTF